MSDDEGQFDDTHDESLLKAAEAFQEDESALNKLPEILRNSLLPFQREGVSFGIRRNGCLLLADEMGLGKTIQAISIGALYESEWPMLVVVPSSMKYVWLDEIQKWLPHLTPDEIHLVRCAEDVPNLVRCKISIVSYGLFQYKRFFALIQNLKVTFKVIICDESHYLKNWRSQRTKHLVKLLHSATRRILLTGTPALARPEELFTQINAIKPGFFGTYTAYCEKYCQGHYNYKLKRFDVGGASNLTELHSLLTSHVMIRRVKSAVLTQLPAKIRQKISFDLSDTAKKEVDKVKARLEEARGNWDEFQIRKGVMELYKETALAKIPACIEYVRDVLKQGSKFLVFAHHIAMLDAVERELVESKTDYIRIDGSVGSAQRQEHVRKFQSQDSCLVALLGIQAAGVGLTLTAASLVVFCELHWSPGVLYQAEDRVHRISQKNAVNIYYLIGLGTIDEMLWRKLNRKVDVVGKALEGKGGDMNTDETADEDIKSVLAACTGGYSPIKYNKRQNKKKMSTSPEKKPAALTFSPGQTKLTNFLNMSVDEDFVNTPGSKSVKTIPKTAKSAKSVPKATKSASAVQTNKVCLNDSKVDDILSQAEMKRDRLQMSRYEKKKRTRDKEKSENETRKKRVQIKCSADQTTSKYFETNKSNEVIDIGSSSEDDVNHAKSPRTILPLQSTEPPAKTNPPVIFIDETSKDSFPILSHPIPNHSASSHSGIDPMHEQGLQDPTEIPVLTDCQTNDHSPSDGCRENSNSTRETSDGSGETTDVFGDDGNCSDSDLFTDKPVDTIQFSVSAFTERVYLYDYTGVYLEVNCLLQDLLDDTSLPSYLTTQPHLKQQALQFAQHWTEISKATQARLYNKILSDLDGELKRMFESRVHCTVRKMAGPKEAGEQSLVKVRKLNVGKKVVEVEQKFSKQGHPLCLSCESLVVRLKSKTSALCLTNLDSATNSELVQLPFQGRFCSLECSRSYGIKANSSSFVRKILFDLEFGVCQLCGLDTNKLLKQLKLADGEDKVKLINSTTLKSLTEKQKSNIVEHPTEGLLWQADHIVPVAEGGGQTDIDNFRTLCTICHKHETKKLMLRLREKKDKEANKKKGILDIRKFLG